MTPSGTPTIDRFYEALNGRNLDALIALYSPDALVIRFDGTSTGGPEIREFFSAMLADHGTYELHTLDQVTQSGDVVMWDALVTTSKGVIETTEVLVLDDSGKIRRHIPGLRGYWGR